MLVGIVGTICSGKHTTAEYLVQHHGFLRLHLPSQVSIAKHGTDDWKRLLPSVTDEKGTRGLTFPDVDSLLEFVTKRWQEHWVITDISDEVTLEALLRRPFFLLLSIDAPVSIRYSRFNFRCSKRSLAPVSLEQFINVNDILLYGSSSASLFVSKKSLTPSQNNGVDEESESLLLSSSSSSSSPESMTKGGAHLTSHSHLQIINHHPGIKTYYKFLDTLSIPSQSRLRPPWDAYFMHLAHLASLRSNCMKRRVGCVLVINNRIVSTGYNGTPRNLKNCNEGGCSRCNVGPGAGNALSTCLCLHAEENALLEAGRERIREGAVLYCDTCPCLTCSVKIAQVGVKEVVYSQSYNMDEASRAVLAEAGVHLRQYSPPKSGLVGLGAATGAQRAHEVLPMDLVVRNQSG